MRQNMQIEISKLKKNILRRDLPYPIPIISAPAALNLAPPQMQIPDPPLDNVL